MVWTEKPSHLFISTNANRSLESAVDTVTGIRAGWPRNRGSISDRDKRFYSSPKHPDRLWGPPRPILARTQPPIQLVQRSRVKLITHFDLVSRLRISGATLLPRTSSHRVQDKFAFTVASVSVVGRVIQNPLWCMSGFFPYEQSKTDIHFHVVDKRVEPDLSGLHVFVWWISTLFAVRLRA